jgi:electron transfer flavoprotein alpha subunit
MAGVWIFAENKEQTMELLNAGRSLAGKMGVKLSVMIVKDRVTAQECIACGADEVMIVGLADGERSLDALVPVIAEEAKNGDPDLLMIAATAKGKELAARLAARLDTGLCSNCNFLDYNKDSGFVEMERLAYGGAVVQKVACDSRPAMVTIPPRLFDPAVADKAGEGAVREISIPGASQISITAVKAKEKQDLDITEAKVVVCVGRGFEKKEDMKLAEDLASLLGGGIGCTRPISDEMHWLPEDLCIGLSGVQIKPELYIGLGVSGQIQHVTGIRGARVICSVNKDENAPILGASDFGIVGDLYDIVPKLIQELEKLPKP